MSSPAETFRPDKGFCQRFQIGFELSDGWFRYRTGQSLLAEKSTELSTSGAEFNERKLTATQGNEGSCPRYDSIKRPNSFQSP
jgi:hypothetical protein